MRPGWDLTKPCKRNGERGEMKRTALFAVFLAAAVYTSAWLGKEDAKASPGQMPPAKLNTAARQRMGPASDSSDEQASLYEEAVAQRQIYRQTRALLPMAQQLAKPKQGEWRSLVREPEQDFADYLNESRRVQGVMIVQPIGDLPPDQLNAIPHLLDAIAHFFGMTAVCYPAIPLDTLPKQCFRMQYGHRQINAEYLMGHVLQPKVKGEVASVIALTNLDIYPGEQWPFESAYGWSSFNSGTSVLSMNQILTPGPADKGQNLLRIVKLSLHELCHTFTIKHCAKYNCLMNGCGDIEENDSKPLLLCPDCLAKLSLATGRDPEWHIRSMLELCKAKGFFQDANHYYRALTMLKQL